MAPYGASKAALRFINDALRVEMRPYGVDVVEFIPGSFVMQSNITARQAEYGAQQRAAFTAEQEQFYGDYFQRYSDFLKVLSGKRPAGAVQDDGLMRKFEAALLENGPKATYKHEPLRFAYFRTRFFILLINFSMQISNLPLSLSDKSGHSAGCINRKVHDNAKIWG